MLLHVSCNLSTLWPTIVPHKIQQAFLSKRRVRSVGRLLQLTVHSSMEAVGGLHCSERLQGNHGSSKHFRREKLETHLSSEAGLGSKNMWAPMDRRQMPREGLSQNSLSSAHPEAR